MLIQQKIMLELFDVPESKLESLYEIIHYFKMGLMQEDKQERVPGMIQGTLSECFFDTLPDEELIQWE